MKTKRLTTIGTFKGHRCEKKKERKKERKKEKKGKKLERRKKKEKKDSLWFTGEGRSSRILE